MMTNTQLWVVVAVPSVMALIGILLNQRGLDRLEDRIDKRMAAFEARLNSIEANLLNLIFDHEKRISHLEPRSK